MSEKVATSPCGKHVEGGGSVMAYPCVVENGHDGPCMAYEVQVSVRRREQWRKERREQWHKDEKPPEPSREPELTPEPEGTPEPPETPQETLGHFQGQPQTTAQRYTENATPFPSREQPQQDEIISERDSKFPGVETADPCLQCQEGAHGECDVFIDEGAVDAEQFVGLTCSCFDATPAGHERMRYPSMPEATRTRPEDQRLPRGNQHPAIHDLVAEDIRERQRVGVSRYGQPLQGFNDRDTLQDAYEEVLDLAVYLRTLRYMAEAEHIVVRAEVRDAAQEWLSTLEQLDNAALDDLAERVVRRFTGGLPEGELG